jgi:uncharacterized protein DUF5990
MPTRAWCLTDVQRTATVRGANPKDPGIPQRTCVAFKGQTAPCDDGVVLIRIEGSDLPGRSCGTGPDHPDGHHNVHVAVQGRKGQEELCGLHPGDARSAHWELECEIVSSPPRGDVRGPQIHGSPGRRFIYLSWGAIDLAGAFTMFRRAKLWLDAVPDEVMTEAIDCNLLVGRLGLTDSEGWPLCASVRPPQIAWSAA